MPKMLAHHLSHKKVVILCDRGTMTGAAYTTPAEFEQIISETGYLTVDLRERRYDGVLFLRSVAVDKPELYTLANNTARKETAEEARVLDKKTENAWVGCEKMWFVGNQTDMYGKSLKALQAVCRILGIPQPLEIERKYLISPMFDMSLVSKYPSAVTVEIVQQYLVSEKPGSERVRARSQAGGTAYYHTVKEEVSPGVRLEYQHQIDQREYTDFLRRADPQFTRIEKNRTCFVYQDQYFECDVFTKPVYERYLEVELTQENTEVTLPDFFSGYITNVTNDFWYSNAEIARRGVNNEHWSSKH